MKARELIIYIFFHSFYTALALQELVNEKSISSVSEKYKIHRGLLQNLQQTASTFAGIVTTFCKSLQWNLLGLILAQFRERLFFGIHPDLIDLMKIPSMSSTRIARALYKNGIEKLSDLANCKTLSVENVLIDLGENFFVIGKSMEMSVQEVARLMINDARRSIQSEMGLKEVQWSQLEDDNITEDQQKSTEVPLELIQVPEETSKGNQRKRKAETFLKSSEPLDDISTPVKKKRSELDTSADYRKKLRSSGGPQDLINIDTQFLTNLDMKAENERSVMERSDENASLFQAPDVGEESEDESTSLLQLTQQHLEIIDVLADANAFKLFKKEVNEQKEIGMSIGVKKFQIQSQMIGGNLLKASETQVSKEHNFTFDGTFYIDCISFCFKETRVSCMNLQDKDTLMVRNFFKDLMNRADLTLNIYEARENLKILQKVFGFTKHVNVKFCDPRLASWLIDPDTNFNWQEMVQKFAPKHLNILELATKHSSVSSLGLNHMSRVDPKVRTAVECFLTNELIHQQLELLKNTGNGLLVRVYHDLEMSIQVRS